MTEKDTKEAVVVSTTFGRQGRDPSLPSEHEATPVSFSSELRRVGKGPPVKSETEARVTNLIQRLAVLIDENRNELEVANKRIDHLTIVVRRLLGELQSRGVIT